MICNQQMRSCEVPVKDVKTWYMHTWENFIFAGEDKYNKYNKIISAALTVLPAPFPHAEL